MLHRIPLTLALLLLACGGDSGTGSQLPAGRAAVRLQQVAEGLDSPVYLTAPPGDSRLFVVEQPGRIRIIQNGGLLPTPFLDITDRVRSGGERGLLSVAFHPQYRSNGYLYVNYTDRSGDTRIERYRVGSDRNRADPASAMRLLSVEQPYANHNGGLLKFGPDGMLYIGMGDGGSGGDPQNHGQRLDTLLGAMLRIDVDRGTPYGIPADNPFAGRADARGEIWAYGLRNPWRFSFDRATGELFIADVGQNAWEEVHVTRAGEAGVNYGWKTLEGSHCFRTDSCERAGLALPVLEYPHSDGCSITGGYVYRGRALPDLVGHYFYADYCRGWIRSFRHANGRATEERRWELGDAGSIASFGEDAAGELYVIDKGGKVFKLVE